jgi:ubiquinone/menaquinone biosynthesis C-methylase UbiE
MNHNDHVNLLRPAALKPGGSWADLGAGSGAFTFALRELVGPTAEVYAVDKDRNGLQELARGYLSHFGDGHRLQLVHGDFSKDVELPPLDGAVMANSLHYFREKETVLLHVRTLLKPSGILLLVEYNVDTGNPWVPYPLSFETYRELAPRAGFSEPRLLARIPSRFLREFYSAISYSGARD